MVKTLSSQKLVSGSVSPDFLLKGVDNKMHSLKEFDSKSFLVVFICNHCPYVKARIDDIVSLQSKFDNSDLQVIGINSNDPKYEGEGFDNMVEFSKYYSLNFPYLIDDTQNVAKEFGAVWLLIRFYLMGINDWFFTVKLMMHWNLVPSRRVILWKRTLIKY